MPRHKWQPKHRYRYPEVCLCPDDHDADCELLRPIDIEHIGGSWGLATIVFWVVGMLTLFAACT